MQAKRDYVLSVRQIAVM